MCCGLGLLKRRVDAIEWSLTPLDSQAGRSDRSLPRRHTHHALLQQGQQHAHLHRRLLHPQRRARGRPRRRDRRRLRRRRLETPASDLQRPQSRSRRRHRVSQAFARRPGFCSSLALSQTISIGTAAVDIPAVPAASALPQTEYATIDEMPLIELVADVPTRKRGKSSTSRNSTRKRTKRIAGRKSARGKRRKTARKTYDDASEIGSFSDVGSWEVSHLFPSPSVPKARRRSLRRRGRRRDPAASVCAAVASDPVAVAEDSAEPAAAAGVAAGRCHTPAVAVASPADVAAAVLALPLATVAAGDETVSGYQSPTTLWPSRDYLPGELGPEGRDGDDRPAAITPVAEIHGAGALGAQARRHVVVVSVFCLFQT